MPLFGKKKESEKKMSEKSPQGGGYPKQTAGYPTQQSYPAQGYSPQGVEQPPPYSAVNPQVGAQPGYAYQGYPPQPQYYPQQPQYAYPQQTYCPPSYIPPGSQVLGYGQFDAGARFDSGASMRVPPPPPGCAPNAAQMAAMHGGTVVMSQGKAGFFHTSSDGGVATHID